ncbi:MAG: hypothetical protein WA951_09070 [Leeuwenhoekiella sp.]
MESNAGKSEVRELLKKYEKLKQEAEDLKESDPEKSEQKKWEATQVSREIEKSRG